MLDAGSGAALDVDEDEEDQAILLVETLGAGDKPPVSVEASGPGVEVLEEDDEEKEALDNDDLEANGAPSAVGLRFADSVSSTAGVSGAGVDVDVDDVDDGEPVARVAAKHKTSTLHILSSDKMFRRSKQKIDDGKKQTTQARERERESYALNTKKGSNFVVVN